VLSFEYTHLKNANMVTKIWLNFSDDPLNFFEQQLLYGIFYVYVYFKKFLDFSDLEFTGLSFGV
jgi:hypothetical protein